MVVIVLRSFYGVLKFNELRLVLFLIFYKWKINWNIKVDKKIVYSFIVSDFECFFRSFLS